MAKTALHIRKTNKTRAKKNINLEQVSSIQTTYEGQAFDTLLHAWLGRTTGWVSPASLGMAVFDWLSHLAISPAKQVDLSRKLWKRSLQLLLYTAACSGLRHYGPEVPCVQARSQDHRFDNEAWQKFPYNLYAQVLLSAEQWWDEAITSIRGVSKHHDQVVNFTARQILDMLSPSNSPFTNPEVIAETMREGGGNFVKGALNYAEDLYRITYQLPPAGTEKFKVGENLAITKGKVIYRNRLIELIQYEPTTKTVYAEPILIIPAWIMKYYILDLSPHNSLVKYLVDQGHTVFMISWKNPTSEDHDLGLEDYLNLGIMSALEVINTIIPRKKVHAVGYCLGGTLLMIAAAAMANSSDERLKSITLFAAQVDFRDAGELSLFIDQSQISYLEDIMWERGYLDGSQMAWTFSMLRSNDLIWSRMIHNYLLGKRRPINDLVAWDYDTTRLPFRMHSEYLHQLFLNNNLVEGRFQVNKKRVALVNIKMPIFAVGTIKDHVSPWRSVYRVNLFTNTNTTFVLTSGGHNAGVVSEPGHKGRTYQIATRKQGEKYISSDTWIEITPTSKGSWWPAWEQWLTNLSSDKTSPPTIGNAKKHYTIVGDAPGTYVLQK